MLIFEWLNGGHVACLINFIPPPAFFSRLAAAAASAATTEGRRKKKRENVDVRQKKKKKNGTFRSIRMTPTVRIELHINMPKKKLLHDETET